MSGLAEIHLNQHPQQLQQQLHHPLFGTVLREPEQFVTPRQTLHCALRVCGHGRGLQTLPGSTSEGRDPWITPALTPRSPHRSLQAPHSAPERVQQQGWKGPAQKAQRTSAVQCCALTCTLTDTASFCSRCSDPAAMHSEVVPAAMR